MQLRDFFFVLTIDSVLDFALFSSQTARLPERTLSRHLSGRHTIDPKVSILRGYWSDDPHPRLPQSCQSFCRANWREAQSRKLAQDNFEEILGYYWFPGVSVPSRS